MNWTDAISNLKLPPLQEGAHDSPRDGLCALEMISYMERLPHSDHPECTCQVIAAYVRQLNDMLPDSERNRLLPYLPRLVGTVSPEHERARCDYLAWQAIRVFASIALRAVGLHEHAERLIACADFAAANAAGAAADAADAAYAAYAARAAANAAGAAADAADAADDPWLPAFEVLEGVLAIGPAPRGFRSLEALPALERLAC